MTEPSGLFQWTDEYSVGVEEIDNQHRTLFELINRLFMAAVNREHESAIPEILAVLIDYTRTHFSLEEELLADVGYADLEAHHEEHLRFIEKMETVTRKYQEGKVVTFELINFLKRWLKEHILETDQHYRSAIAGASIAADNWATHAREVVAAKNRADPQRTWWKFWE